MVEKVDEQTNEGVNIEIHSETKLNAEDPILITKQAEDLSICHLQPSIG